MNYEHKFAQSRRETKGLVLAALLIGLIAVQARAEENSAPAAQASANAQAAANAPAPAAQASANAPAPQSAEAPALLTLAKAREAALANSNALKEAGIDIESALLTEKQQSYTYLPSISASVTGSASYDAGKGSTLGDSLGVSAKLSLSETVWDGSAAVLARIDRLATQSAREAARVSYYTTLDTADSCYFSVLENEAIVEAAKSALETARINFSVADAKYSAGTITRTDYLEYESEVSSNETALSQAQRDLSLARRKLSSYTGMALPFSLEQIDFNSYDEMINRVSAYSEEQGDSFAAALRKLAEASNPDLAQARIAVEKANAAVDEARAGYLPTVSASVSNTTSVSAGSGFDPASGSISVTAAVPLNIWATKTKVDIADSAAKKTNLQSEETKRTFGLDVDSAVFDCMAQARSVISSEKAYEYAKNHYESELELYKLSTASSTALSTAAQLVSTNLKSLIAARYGFLSCIAQIRSIGAFESDEAVMKVFP